VFCCSVTEQDEQNETNVMFTFITEKSYIMVLQSHGRFLQYQNHITRHCCVASESLSTRNTYMVISPLILCTNIKCAGIAQRYRDGLRAARLKSRGSIPGRGKRFLSSPHGPDGF
jgi:hypothetical protein